MNLENLFALLKQYGPAMLDAIQNRGYDPGLIQDTVQPVYDRSYNDYMSTDNMDFSRARRTEFGDWDVPDFESLDEILSKNLSPVNEYMQNTLANSDFTSVPTSVANYIPEIDPQDILSIASDLSDDEVTPAFRYSRQMARKNMF